MRAVVYSEPGGPEVLQLVDRPTPEPGPGEVRVRVAVSGVNPTDWKSRANGPVASPKVPNQDGAGVVDAVGPGVAGFSVGDVGGPGEGHFGMTLMHERARSAGGNLSVRSAAGQGVGVTLEVPVR